MENLTKLILFFFVLIQVCECEIRCYVCSTSTGLYPERCGDNFRLTAVDSFRCQGSCQKTRGYRTEGSRRVIEVTRGCVPFTDNERCDSGSHNGISADVCYCNTELCNTGPQPSPTLTVLILSTVSSSVFMLLSTDFMIS